MGKLFFKPGTLMANKEEQGLSPALSTLTQTHIHTSQPASNQPASQLGPFMEGSVFSKFVSFMSPLNGAIH